MTNNQKAVDFDKPIIAERFADNGEHSHWELIEPKDGAVLWSSDPEETLARGNRILSTPPIEASGSMTVEAENFANETYERSEHPNGWQDVKDGFIGGATFYAFSQSKRIEELEREVKELQESNSKLLEAIRQLAQKGTQLKSEKSSLEASRSTFLDEIRILSERVVKLEGELKGAGKEVCLKQGCYEIAQINYRLCPKHLKEAHDNGFDDSNK